MAARVVGLAELGRRQFGQLELAVVGIPGPAVAHPARVAAGPPHGAQHRSLDARPYVPRVRAQVEAPAPADLVERERDPQVSRRPARRTRRTRADAPRWFGRPV